MLMKIALAILAVFVVAKFVRRRYGRGGSCRSRGGGSRRRLWPFFGLRDLGLSDEQEHALREQAKLFRARVSAQNIGRDSRTHLAAVLRSESFDAEILGDMFASHDDALRTLRLEAVERLAAVHEVLDPDQRDRLASKLERGRGMPSGGPFR